MTTDQLSLTPAALKILVVCTANRCRSPVAEALLWRELVLRNVPSMVLSAGFLDRGHPADATMSEVMAHRGVDLRHHRSEQITPEELADADLIMTMERRHAREIVIIGGIGLPVHTMRGFVEVAQTVEPRGDVYRWLAEVSAARADDAFTGNGRPDEITDPIGKPAAVHHRTVDEIQQVCIEVATLLATAYPQTGATPTSSA